MSLPSNELAAGFWLMYYLLKDPDYSGCHQQTPPCRETRLTPWVIRAKLNVRFGSGALGKKLEVVSEGASFSAKWNLDWQL